MEKNKKEQGFYTDDDSLWAGAEKKEDAPIRMDFENGRIYYENCYCNCCKDS